MLSFTARAAPRSDRDDSFPIASSEHLKELLEGSLTCRSKVLLLGIQLLLYESIERIKRTGPPLQVPCPLQVPSNIRRRCRKII